jgi:hypothetical protein
VIGRLVLIGWLSRASILDLISGEVFGFGTGECWWGNEWCGMSYD